MKCLALSIVVALSAAGASVNSDELDKAFENLKQAEASKDAA